jgi:cathepsin B
LYSRWKGQALVASKNLCGLKADYKQTMKQALAEGRMEVAPQPTEEQVAAIPTSFDAAVAFPTCATMINEIRDQSNCGCCWAFGASEAASDRLCINTNGALTIPLSSQALCFCASPDGCNGGDLNTPWEFIKNAGLVSGAGQGNGTYDAMGFCSDFSLPHCHHHGPQGSDPYPDEGSAGCPSESSVRCPKACDSNAKAPHNTYATDKYTFKGGVQVFNTVAAIQTAIMTDGPVECAFTVYSDFENYVSGVYKHTGGTQLGGHAVKITGWGVDPKGGPYWKIANSWNPFWGEEGFFRIVRGSDECGIEDDVVATAAGAVWSKKA